MQPNNDVTQSERGLAFRRHNERRLKHNRADYHVAQGDTPRHVGKALKTPANCACWMCRNPRRVFGQPTLQEQRLGFFGGWGKDLTADDGWGAVV